MRAEMRPSNSITQPDSSRHLIPVFVFFTLLQLLFFAPRLNSDGAYYYEYVRSLVIQGDLNFDDEREFYTWEFVPVLGNIDKSNWEETGYRMNIFAFGAPMVWLPVYAATHGMVTLLNGMGAGLSTGGYGLAYRFPVMFLSMITGILALMLMDRIGALAGLKPVDRTAALLLILGASHYPAFLFVTPAFSHAAGTAAMCAFFYAWYRWRDAGWGLTGHALYGAVAGLAVTIRWQNAFCLILPMVDAAVSLGFAPGRKVFQKRLLRWFVFAVMLLLTVSPQLLVTDTLYGTPVTDPQGRGGMKWSNPEFFLVLFEANKGLFVVNPVLLISVVGIPLVFLRDFRMAWGFILAFLLQTYINSIRRDWSGVGFGMRRFLNLLPVFALGLGMLFHVTGKKLRSVPRIILYACGGFLVLWNLLLMGQYYLSELGAPWHPVPFRTVLERQFAMAPDLLVELMRGSLFISGLDGNLLHLAASVFALVMTVFISVAAIRFRSDFPLMRFVPATVLVAAVIFLLVTNAAIVLSRMNTESHHVLEMTSEREFGRLRHLELNPVSGYQGTPGGVVFGPGERACVVNVRREYDPNRFIALGRMHRSLETPCRMSRRLQFKFLPFHHFTRVQLISRVISPAAVEHGRLVAEISLMTERDGMLRLPIRYGMETGSGEGRIDFPGTDVLLRSYPAVNPVQEAPVWDSRYTWTLNAPYRIRLLILEAVDPDLEFQVHGIAFL